MSDPSRFRLALAGVGVTPVTPFSDDLLAPDLAALADNLSFLVEAGIGLLYLAGNTGEVASLSAEEWTAIVETAVETVGERAVVAAGVGHEYPVAQELARHAAAIGASGILAMPRHDVSAFATTVANDTSDVMWTCGLADRYAPFFHMAGAVGFTSGLANFAPRTARALHGALRDAEWEEASRVRSACVPIEEIRPRNGNAYNVAAVKVGMDAVGLAGEQVRPPLVSLDPRSTDEEAAKDRLLAAFAEVPT